MFLNFCASVQKFKYVINLLSKIKQLTHEKVDNLPTQNLEYKQTGRHNDEIKYLKRPSYCVQCITFFPDTF